jgi:hypothetical protein
MNRLSQSLEVGGVDGQPVGALVGGEQMSSCYPGT